MNARGNLADPAYEPSDDDLARLMHDAFEHVIDAREESLRSMRARIARTAPVISATISPSRLAGAWRTSWG